MSPSRIGIDAELPREGANAPAPRSSTPGRRLARARPSANTLEKSRCGSGLGFATTSGMHRGHRSRMTLIRFFGTALAMTAFACSDEAPEPFARVYTGELTGTDVRVGIIATEQRARVFFCGGASTYETM